MSEQDCCTQFGPELVAHLMNSNRLVVADLSRPRQSKRRIRFFSLMRLLDLKLLKFSSRVCMLNLFDEKRNKQEEEEEDEEGKCASGGGEHRMRYWRNLILNWPILITSLILYSIVGLIRSLYYHYALDYYILHLDRVREGKCMADRDDDIYRPKSSDSQRTSFWWCTNTTSQLEIYLASQVDLKRLELAHMGSPFRSAPSFSAQCWYITWICYTLLIVTNMALNLSGGRLRVNYIKLLTNPLAEQSRLNGLALQEANKYLASQWNFNQAHLRDSDSADVVRQGNKSISYHWMVGEPVFSVAEARRFAADYEQNKEILQSILVEGNVIRFFSFTTDWLDRRASFHCLNFIATTLFYASSQTIMPFTLSNWSHQQQQTAIKTKVSLNELISLGQMMMILYTFIFAGCVHSLLSIVDWLDEIEVLGRQRNLIIECIHANNRLFFSGRQLINTQSSSIGYLMNSNLLFVLINHKIYPFRAKQSLWNQNCGANISLRLLFVFPLIVRLHASYCSPELLMSMVYICVANSLIATVLILNCCHLNDKIMLLYKPMSSLMAHLIELNQHCQLRQMEPIYSEHSMWCLRQELTDLARFQNPSMRRWGQLSIYFTFSMLMRIYFWHYLLLLSVFTETRTSSSSDRFLRDPLRLYERKFYLQN